LSLDITVYKDDELEISANVGSWGTRFYLDNEKYKGQIVFSGLLNVSRLEEMIFRLQKIRDHLKGDYSFDLVRDFRDYDTIEFLEETGGASVES
jgi:hypothetical protein